MRAPALLSAILALIPGCMLVSDDDDDDAVCAPEDVPEPAPPRRNPENLACESFGAGCDPRCEVCVDLAPTPTWGACGSACDRLGEAACTNAPGCRVIKDAACALYGFCPEFRRCVATDQVDDLSVDCYAARDGLTCSRSSGCTAYHYQRASDPRGELAFATCTVENASPGACSGQVTCKRAPPRCPESFTPAVLEGCYTGGCLPLELCGPRPL